jgi:single stranded DNA-binding protein (ssb)
MINKAIIMGRVGRDPDIRTTRDDKKVANFSVATSETWKDARGDRQEKTTWHNIVIWNEGLVKVVERYVQKGDLIYLEGQIEKRKWKDDSGNERETTEIVLKAFDGRLKLIPTGKQRGDDDHDRDRDRDRNGYRERRGDGGSRRQEQRYHDLDDDIPF